MSAHRIDNLIIGAGPAGLATAACLREQGAEFEILERSETVGSSWRTHYERLHLHTPASHSHLPFRKFPDAAGTYPSREHIVEYLGDYAAAFDLEPLFSNEVSRAWFNGSIWHVEASDSAWETKNLIVATGYNGVPYVPQFEGEETFEGQIVHSKQYFSGKDFAGLRVMVVGSGNSGAEIAIDLFECGATPFICIRGPVHVNPRDFMGVPAQIFALQMARLPYAIADKVGVMVSKMKYPDLEELGIRRPAKGPISMIAEDGRVPMIDIGTIDLIRQGALSVVGGVDHFDAHGARFVDQRYEELDAVVLATGYRSGLSSWLETASLNHKGLPTEFDGPAAPGLYFVGFRNPPTGALWDIHHEALAVASHAARRG